MPGKKITQLTKPTTLETKKVASGDLIPVARGANTISLQGATFIHTLSSTNTGTSLVGTKTFDVVNGNFLNINSLSGVTPVNLTTGDNIISIDVNSLVTRVNELSAAQRALASAQVVASNQFDPLNNNIRLSLTTTPVPDAGFTDITSNTLYLHPYGGATVSLYNATTQRWVSYNINTPIAFSLSTLTANTNYDIYLFINNSNNIGAEFIPWSSSLIGTQPPSRDITFGGAPTKIGDPTRKYVGCLRTTTAGTCVMRFGYNGLRLGSSPSFYLWNYYNRVRSNYNLKFVKTPGTPEGTSWWTADASYRTIPLTGDDRTAIMREIGGSSTTIATGARVSFITGDYSDAFMSASMLVNTGIQYYIYGVNVNETTYKKTIGDLLTQSPFSGMYEGGAAGTVLTNTIAGGFKGYSNIVPLLAEYTSGNNTALLLYSGTIDYRHTFLWSGYVEC